MPGVASSPVDAARDGVSGAHDGLPRIDRIQGGAGSASHPLPSSPFRRSPVPRSPITVTPRLSVPHQKQWLQSRPTCLRSNRGSGEHIGHLRRSLAGTPNRIRSRGTLPGAAGRIALPHAEVGEGRTAHAGADLARPASVRHVHAFARATTMAERAVAVRHTPGRESVGEIWHSRLSLSSANKLEVHATQTPPLRTITELETPPLGHFTYRPMASSAAVLQHRVGD